MTSSDLERRDAIGPFFSGGSLHVRSYQIGKVTHVGKFGQTRPLSQGADPQCSKTLWVSLHPYGLTQSDEIRHVDVPTSKGDGHHRLQIFGPLPKSTQSNQKFAWWSNLVRGKFLQSIPNLILGCTRRRIVPKFSVAWMLRCDLLSACGS